MFLLLLGPPAQQRIIHQRVLHVHHDARGGVHARHLFDRQNCLKEFAAAAAILFRDLDSHQPKLKELVDQVFVEHAFFVHLLDQRPDFLVGELADVVAKHEFVFGERGQRRRRGGLQRNFRHGIPSDLRMANLEF